MAGTAVSPITSTAMGLETTHARKSTNSALKAAQGGLLGSALLLVSCNALWGLDELNYENAATTGTTSTGGAGGDGGGGAAGAAATGGAGGAGGTAGSGGTGGAGGDATDCGNGTIEGAEECDDANGASDDGCAGCKVECDGSDQLHVTSTHHCYWLTDADAPWATVRQECIAAGAELAAITSMTEQAFVQTLITEPAYLGATDSATEGTFVWMTGEVWSFENWAANEPNDDYGEDCLVNTPAGNWNDGNCSTPNRGLCERPPPEANP